MRIGGLRDEQRGDGEIDRRAVQIERIAGGHNEAHYGFRAAQLFELDEQSRQNGFGRRRSQNDQQLLANVDQQFPHAESMDARDQAEHHKYEQAAGEVHARQQLAQRQKGLDAVLADGKRHGAECADGRELHDDGDDFEQPAGDGVDDLHHQLALLKGRERDSEQDGDEENLQDLAAGEGAHDGIGNDVEQKIDGVQFFSRRRVLRHRFGVERGWIGVDARAGPDQGHYRQSDEECDGRDHFEIKQSLDADAAQLFEIADVGDAGDDGAEDDGSDHHADHLDESVAERLHAFAGRGIERAQRDSDQDAGDDLEVETFVEASSLFDHEMSLRTQISGRLR